MDDLTRMPSTRTQFRSCLVTAFLAVVATYAMVASALENGDQTSSESTASLYPSATDCPDKGLDLALVPVPAEILHLVPKDSVLLGYSEADFNLDGRLDDLLVVEKNCSQRILLVALRQHDGSLSIATSNDHLIWCLYCIGESGDYYIYPAPGRFRVPQFYLDGHFETSEDLTFVWSKKRHTWIVKKAVGRTWDRYENTTDEKNDLSSAIGVTFEDYRSSP